MTSIERRSTACLDTAISDVFSISYNPNSQKLHVPDSNLAQVMPTRSFI